MQPVEQWELFKSFPKTDGIIIAGDLSAKKYLIDNYVSGKGKFDLYILFIEKSLNLLKDGGYFSFIIPNKFAQTKYGKSLKEFMI